MSQVQIFTTGGTIDKVYFDALSEFQVGETALDAILREANVDKAFRSQELIECCLPGATRLFHLSHHIRNDQVLQDGELLSLTNITTFESLC